MRNLFLLGAMLLCVISASAIQAPERLRADGSNLRAESAQHFAIGSNGVPVLTWAPRHEENNQEQRAFQIQVFQSHLQHGKSPDEPVWDSGRVESTTPKASYGGDRLRGRTSFVWAVRWWDAKGNASPWSAKAEFHIAPTFDAAAAAPSWIASVPDAAGTEAMNLFRSTFEVASAATKATLYICGLGYSYATVNGQAVNEQLLTTAPWSNNERRNGFSSIDVTKLVAKGSNVLGVALGHGWRAKIFSRKDAGESGYDKVDKTFWAELHVVNADGSEAVVVDTAKGAWEGAAGPSVYDDVYNGETYDASKEQVGWDAVGFEAAEASGWTKLQVSTDPPKGGLAAWSAPPVLLDRVVSPVAITQPYPGTFVVDFGANLAGVCKLSNIQLPAGANVTLVHAEIMQHALLPDVPHPDPKLVYVGNLRSAKATDVYISKGGKTETFYPRFTYHGFRFVQITGLKTLNAADIEMHHFHSANAPKTTAVFKSQVMNQVMKMGVGSQRSNMMTVQTDCDQRDERLGWMGDANLSGDSIVLNFDSNPFLFSYLKTMNDELDADGSSVDTAPSVRFGGRPGDISWTTAYISVPYAMYKSSGDLKPAATFFDGYLAHVANIDKQCKGRAGKTCPTKYGDWVPTGPPGKGQGPKPTKPYTSAFSYIDAVSKVAEMAHALGNSSVASKFASVRAKLVDDFNADFFAAANNTYDNGLMTTYTLPLHLGIVPKDHTAAVQKKLLDLVTTTYKGHNQCGIIGFKFLFEQLSAMGRDDVALSALETSDYPSIGFMANNKYEPATENVWELWDAYTEGVGMNSRNHHMFSSYTKYLIEHPGGMRQAEGSSGFQDVLFEPPLAVGLSGATVTSQLEQGEIRFEWERAGGLQCSKVTEGNVAALSCGQDGGVVTKVRFASYGKPVGLCGAFGAADECHADVTLAVEQLCLGKASCDVTADAATLMHLTGPAGGRPCLASADGAPHRLFVELECSSPPAIRATIDVPISTKGTVRFPAAGMSQPKLSAAGGHYAARTVQDAAGHDVVEVAIGSGKHTLALTATAPAVLVDGVANGDRLDLACPKGYKAGRARFASFGNPKKSEAGVWTRGACHLGTAVAEAEAACIGSERCSVRVNAARIANEEQCADVIGTAALAVQLECVPATLEPVRQVA